MPVEHPGVSIDECHADLLYGLIRAHKPASVLELGFGGGRSCDTILRGLRDNEQAGVPFTLVDNWGDWGNERPEHAYRDGVNIVTEDERKFTHYCQESYDFIFSDADHGYAHEWFDITYGRMLNPGGVLCYHDVRLYENLWGIVEECRRLGLSHVVFEKNSIEGEWCERGLLVIFKNQ